MFEQAILTSEHAKERQVGIVADGENVSAGTLRFRKLLPRGRVPGGDLSILNGTARRAAVAQDDQISIARAGRGGLLQSGLQSALQIGAAPQAAAANRVNGVLNTAGIGGADGHNLCFGVEQHQSEVIRRAQSVQQSLKRLIAALQLFPLHRQ